MNSAFPNELDTERLVLRQMVESDWQVLQEHYADVESVRYSIGHVQTPAQSWRTLAMFAGHWQLKGFGPYTVERKDDQQVLGTVGLWYPPDWVQPELTWAFVRRFWGQGYARESARAVLESVRETHPSQQIISFINRDNAPSIRLATLLGAQLADAPSGALDDDWLLFEYPLTQA